MKTIEILFTYEIKHQEDKNFLKSFVSEISFVSLGNLLNILATE